MNKQEFEKLFKKFMIQESKSLKERFDDDDDLGIYSADFDPNEFGGEAMKAAMQDIGDEFEPLGKSKFEKNLNIDDFVADLQRQNLNLPKDKEELSDIEKMMSKKKSHEKKFGAGSLNETGEESDEFEGDVYDTTSLYKFLKDIFYAFLEGEGSHIGYADAAKFAEKELIKHFDIKKKAQFSYGLNEGHVNPDTKINRPKDAEGNPITLKARVEDIETGNVGRVIRFGIDDNSKMTAHIDWLGEFGGRIPKSIVGLDTIVVRDSNRIVREDKEEGEAYPANSRYMFFGNLEQIKRQAGLILDMDEEKINEILEGGHDWAQDHIGVAKENMDQVFDFLMNETKGEEDIDIDIDGFEKEIEESMIRSHANGRGQNLKPGNFPKKLKRVGLNENLDQATSVNDEVFLVVDNDFNRAHYKDLIGKTFDDAPGYAQVKLVSKSEMPVAEYFDYSAAEREHAGQEELDSLEAEAMQVVPESLIEFMSPNSFTSYDNGYSFLLKIPKQANELLKDIELFVKEEIGADKTVQLYTELEKLSNKWIIDVQVINSLP